MTYTSQDPGPACAFDTKLSTDGSVILGENYAVLPKGAKLTYVLGNPANVRGVDPEGCHSIEFKFDGSHIHCLDEGVDGMHIPYPVEEDFNGPDVLL